MFEGTLTGQVAIVTGSSTGIGREIACLVAAAGAHVVVNSRSEERVRPVVEKIVSEGGKASSYAADLLERREVEAMVHDTAAKFGRLDIVVANGAGATNITLPWTFFHQMDPDRMLPIINSHWLSKMYLIRAALEHMVPAGSGRVINVSTDAGLIPTSGESLIGGAAAGLQQMTRVVAREVGRYGVRVNTVSCGPISDNPIDEIEGYRRLRTEAEAAAEAAGPSTKVSPKLMNRRLFPVTMRDVANAVLYLATPLGDNITGQTWSVNGGISMPP